MVSEVLEGHSRRERGRDGGMEGGKERDIFSSKSAGM